MIVYVYNKTTNEKLETYKEVTRVLSAVDEFVIQQTGERLHIIKKENVKLVVYGF